MPFTPFHLGLALVVKPVAQRNFSLLAFSIAQIAMDIEPLIGMIRNSAILHGPTHTYLGAIAIGLLVGFVSPYIYRPIIRRYNCEITFHKLVWLSEPAEPSHTAIWSGAFFGTFSHVFLDSFMHYDMRPFAPFSDANPLLSAISHDGVYQLCVVLGVVGSVAWLITKWIKRRVS